MQQTKERAASGSTVRPDTYGTLLVHAQPGLGSSQRVEVAARLARELDARLIGLGAETSEPLPVADPFAGAATAEWITLLQQQVANDLKAAETAFRRDAAGADVEWRVIRDFPHRAMRKLARAADLIIVGPKTSASAAHYADPAEVVMTSGRPVLVVPEGRSHLRATAIVVAWKDTRECRRAIADALPLLRRAEEVIVHAVSPDSNEEAIAAEVDDVVASLMRRGVRARPCFTVAMEEGVARELETVAQGNGADLIVAGAYGHSRLREWAFGGVTDDFLHRSACFVLMSH